MVPVRDIVKDRAGSKPAAYRFSIETAIPEPSSPNQKKKISLAEIPQLNLPVQCIAQEVLLPTSQI